MPRSRLRQLLPRLPLSLPRRRHELACLAVILLTGFGLRLWGAARAHLTSDESVIWAFASEISVSSPTSVIASSADHPPLGADLARASTWLFGHSDLGLRTVHLIFGSLTVVLVYLIARSLWNGPIGLLAAALLAVDQFHASWSRLILEEGPLLFFVALALWLVARALQSGAASAMVGAGLALGAAYLVKETAVLMLPAVALGLLATTRGRAILRTRATVMGAVALLLVIGVELVRSQHHPDQSYWTRDLEILGRSCGLTAKALALYLGELFQVAFGRGVLDLEYESGSAFTAFWPFGLAYLVAVLYATFRARDPGVRLLLPAFWIPVAVVSVLDASAIFDPFWWASASLIPAVLLCANALSRLTLTRSRLLTAIALVLAIGLLRDIPKLGLPGRAAPRRTRQEWALAMAADGEQRLSQGDRQTALSQARAALLLDPRCARARDLLEATSPGIR